MVQIGSVIISATPVATAELMALSSDDIRIKYYNHNKNNIIVTIINFYFVKSIVTK
jgi:hypothetical protein